MPKMFGKVFLAFWASSLLVVMSIAVLGLALGSWPLLYLWFTRSLDLYGRTAVDLYEHGGAAALEAYLDDMQTTSAIDGTLISPKGAILAQHPIPEKAYDLLARCRTTGQSQFNTQNWSAAITVPRQGGNYILVAQVHPFNRRRLAFNPSAALSRVAVGLVVTTLLCLVMARYLTRPIRDLRCVARRIAEGDLEARAAPLLGKRTDELGELAVDFDLMAEKVQTLIERQQTLLSDISHELRSPLSRLALSSELVRRGDVQAASRMDADIRRLEGLISELLTLSRIEASERRTRTDAINLVSMVGNILQDAEFEGSPEHKDLVQTGRGELMVEGDANLLQRCIENVVRNAVRFTKADTTVEIKVDREEHPDYGSVGVIRVIDEGPGVPADALPRLFEPFFRVSYSRNQREGGAGLGLSISQRIAVLHGGHITASNRSEVGLEVAIYLPLGSEHTRGG